MGKLDGKVALITGGSEGIGLATAQRFIDEGAEHVFITGRRQQVLDEAVKKIGGTKVTGVQCDASKMDDLDKLYTLITKQKGRLDILFANAGVHADAALGAITEDSFDHVFDINVKGVLRRGKANTLRATSNQSDSSVKFTHVCSRTYFFSQLRCEMDTFLYVFGRKTRAPSW